MWLKWLPWKFMIRKLARYHGFLDPVAIWSYFQNFSQPSEVAGPIELIRDSAVFHSRGLINCRAIPQNLDWIWPWWINQQFNPHNKTFIPRAFSLTYVNLTHRNWTAVGQPDCSYYPIIDPSGLVMPHWDGWSIDFFIIDDHGNLYAPSRTKQNPTQQYSFDKGLSVITRHNINDDVLCCVTKMDVANSRPICEISVSSELKKPCRLAVSLRPFNPEGISFVHQVEYDHAQKTWTINNKDNLSFSQEPDEHYLSEYSRGDVINNLLNNKGLTSDKIKCKVGLATAAAVFNLKPDSKNTIEITVPLDTRKADIKLPPSKAPAEVWEESLNDYCRISLPDKHKQFLYDTAVRSVIMHSNQQEVYPGPFTYKRFWFRDAAFILYSMLCANINNRVKNILDTYPKKQKLNGYFQSQYGEWDSNGQALWIMDQYRRFTNQKPNEKWLRTVEKGAEWIIGKCTEDDGTDHAGLLPAGFSAEHFGPNDYYYWDDFWAVAGFNSAADTVREAGRQDDADKYKNASLELLGRIDKSVENVQQKLEVSSIPVSCNRRMDSAAIGSLACRYPAQIYSSNDKRLLETADYLYSNHCFNNGFLLDVSHSGINAYLTLHLAQVFMQSGDERFMPLSDEIAKLASSTGQWPEAIHPQTMGGCMGDGQHIWAAAEWIIFIRNSLVYEDTQRKELIIGSGICKDWSQSMNKIQIGPAPTIWGQLNVEFTFTDDSANIKYDAKWHNNAPKMTVKIPGFEIGYFEKGNSQLKVKRKAAN